LIAELFIGQVLEGLVLDGPAGPRSLPLAVHVLAFAVGEVVGDNACGVVLSWEHDEVLFHTVVLPFALPELLLVRSAVGLEQLVGPSTFHVHVHDAVLHQLHLLAEGVEHEKKADQGDGDPWHMPAWSFVDAI
jgi:hypothetical protein